MEDRVGVDFETRSELDVRNVGAWKYAEHPSTEVLMMSYLDTQTGEKGIWRAGDPFPRILKQRIEENVLFEAHNVQFERAVWMNKLTDIAPLPKRWHDTMASCAYRSLPLSLEEAGEELNLDIKKDSRGKQLIQKLCSPKKPLKKDKEIFKLTYGEDESEWPLIWNEDPEMMAEFEDYCLQDSLTEHELSETIGDLPYSERRLWILDQIMNQRGVYVDLEAVYAAKRITISKSEELTKELQRLTDGNVQTGGQRDKILAYLRDECGVKLKGLTKDDISSALEKDLPEDARRIIEVRQALSRASTKKLDKILECTCDDGRVRGMFQYHGAGTGRVAGRLVQLQNLIRTELDVEQLIKAIKTENSELIELLYGDISNAIAESLRGMFVAAPGKELQQADYDQIEARVLACVAGETWKIEAFRRNEPIYEASAERIYGYKVTKKENPNERQDGKTCELAFGFQGGLGSWRQFDKSDRHTDDAVEEFKDAWRKANRNIVKFWYGIEEAAVECVRDRKTTYYRGFTFRHEVDHGGNWMSIELLSGRKIWYFNVRLNEDGQIEYRGKDPNRHGKFTWLSTYGGKLTNNVVQGTARDIMMHGMQKAEKAGYPTIMTVHDEIVAEVDIGFGSTEDFCSILSDLPEWAKDWPITADGWRGHRYKK